MRDEAVHEWAAVAAALMVDDGWSPAQAVRRARTQLGLPARATPPDAAALEAAVRTHLALFHAATQPAELRALRQTALQWMQRLVAFAPLLGGAVWHGTATRHNDIHLQLFSDDPKAVEVALLDAGVPYEAQQASGALGREVPVLSLAVRCADWNEPVGLHLWINDTRAQRGARLPDALGRVPRGTVAEVRALLAAETAPAPMEEP
ncbi:hypothetical protein [Tepidimonas charontis]|uniref:Uncharacterized protein n=1 Tax=Tepidimonas charontis TaxID=2267262 RepID=A0A554XEW5_9BURK|nr:hypothetical protein [Tepidimonas charontis]TSE34380.1 hypothetical protein Tchar_01474 [Tepidimonas charontis]